MAKDHCTSCAWKINRQINLGPQENPAWHHYFYCRRVTWGDPHESGEIGSIQLDDPACPAYELMSLDNPEG